MQFKPVVDCRIPFKAVQDASHPASQVPCWYPTETASGKAAIVKCGDCRMPLLIARPSGNHSIDANGTVHPSIGCNQCGWHVWGILEGWT